MISDLHLAQRCDLADDWTTLMDAIEDVPDRQALAEIGEWIATK